MISRIASRRAKICVGYRHCLTVFAALFLLLAFACGPAPPQKGTPAFYWGAAKETYAAGDYMKTIDHLDGILESDNEYTARAFPWSLLVTSGLASGYMELADQYEAGAKVKKEAPADFFRQVSRCRTVAGRLTLHFADTLSKFNDTKEDPVTMEFAFPPGTSALVPELASVAKGGLLPAAVADAAEKRALERGILLATVRAAGAPEDPPKAEQILKSGGGKVPRATFMLAMAQTLYEEAELYSWKRENDRDKRMILCHRAQDVLKLLPESSDTKALSAKIGKVISELLTNPN
jgi:hypothetical protein